MKKEEKQLFKQLCSFRAEGFDKKLLQYASPEVLGHLFFNRVQAIAYGVLKEKEYLGMVNREFRNSLKGAYEQNIEQNKTFFQCVNLLSDVLKGYQGKYAMLKGAILCRAYPIGYRTSNDIDLLVRPEDVTLIGKILTMAGFRQGNVRNGEFVQASRKEIIESKMLRGETVPYILEIGLNKMRFLEVDINFSLDYKNSGASALNAMMEQTALYEKYGLSISTLNKIDFFLHLCCHLYKEAAAFPWVEMKRDMSLYKYTDIYMLLEEMTEADVKDLFKRAKELGLEQICSFAVLQTAGLLNMNTSYAVKIAEDSLNDDKDFIHRVVSPSEKKTYLYKTKNIAERFFMKERAADLEEVKNVWTN